MNNRDNNYYPSIRKSQQLPDANPMARAYEQNDQDSTFENIQILDYLKVISRFRNLILSTTALTVIISLIYAFIATPKYSASSKVHIGMYEPVLSNGRSEDILTQKSKEDSFIETQIAELTSFSVADEVLKDQTILTTISDTFNKKSWLETLGLVKTEKFDAALSSKYKNPIPYLEAYLKKIRVSLIRRTNLVELTVVDSNPELASYMANSHAEAYIDWVRNSRINRQSRGLSFLSEEQQKLKKKISDLEREMADYAEENSIIAINEENVDVSKMTQLNEMLVAATRKRIEAEKTYQEALKSKDFESAGNDDHATQQLRTQLATLEAKRSLLLNKFTPAYPEVKQITAEISGLQSMIGSHSKKILTGLKIKAETAKEEEANVKEEFERQQSKTFDLSKKQVQYNALKRDLESHRELLKDITTQIEETGLAVESNATNVSIVDYAVKPLAPTFPRKKLILVISLITGLGIGTCIAFLLNMLDNTVHSPEELESTLKLPNLGVVPTFEHAKKEKRILLGYGSIQQNNSSTKNDYKPVNNDAATPVKTADKTFIIPNHGNSGFSIEVEFINQPQSLASEAYRTIRTGILLSQAGEPPKTILFTSAQSSEGKTTLSSNIAASLASSGAQVVVLDCDLRRPSISKVFKSPINALGMSDVLTGQCDLNDATIKNVVKNVDLIPSGRIPPNPAELLGSSQMAELIDTLASTYDYVLMDTPPILPVTDAVILSKIVDGVVFVVKGDLTPKKVVQDAKQRLTSVGAKILGTVLNNIDLSKRHYGYYAKYHYSYYEGENSNSSAV